MYDTEVTTTHVSPASQAMTAATAPARSLHEDLAQTREQITQQCTAEAKRIGHKLLFGLTTSLALQSVPIPADCAIDATRLHTVSSTHTKRIRSATSILQPHVWKHVDSASIVRINPYVYALNLFQTWAQMSASLSFASLIILGDSIITAIARQPALAQKRSASQVRDDLIAFVHDTPRFKGKVACRRAAMITAINVDSPKESECRLSLLQHGIAGVETGYIVPNAQFTSGAPMTLDMAWPEWKVALEYDGDQHRTDKKQWRRDQEKREHLRSRGWIVVTATGGNLADEQSRAELAFCVARHLARRGAQFAFHVIAQPIEQVWG